VLLDKLPPCILFEKYIYILALEMTSQGNLHSANCIGTFSFPMTEPGLWNLWVAYADNLAKFGHVFLKYASRTGLHHARSLQYTVMQKKETNFLFVCFSFNT